MRKLVYLMMESKHASRIGFKFVSVGGGSEGRVCTRLIQFRSNSFIWSLYLESLSLLEP